MKNQETGGYDGVPEVAKQYKDAGHFFPTRLLTRDSDPRGSAFIWIKWTLLRSIVSDPELFVSVLKWVPWIWIRFGNTDSGSGYRTVKMTSKKS